MLYDAGPALILDVGRGKQICHIYQNSREFFTVLSAFITQALEHQERILLLAPPENSAAIFRILAQTGHELAAYAERGQVELLAPEALYSPAGGLNLEQVTAILDAKVAEAQAAGFAGLALLDDKAWVHEKVIAPARLLELEAQLGATTREQPLRLLCQYNRQTFPPIWLFQLMQRQPHLIIGQQYVYNSLSSAYALPGDFSQWISQIESLHEQQAALLREHHLLHTIVDNLPDYIYVKDKESRFIFSNRAHRQVLGVDELDAVVGKNDFDFFAPALAEQYYADERVVVAQQAVVQKEEMTITAGGQRQWLLTTKVPLQDTKGEIAGLFGISRAITELKLAQEQLEKREKQLNEAQRLAHLGSWEYDLHTHQLQGSPEFYRIYGLDPDSDLLAYPQFFSFVHPCDRAQVEAIILQAMDDHQPFRIEHRIVRPDGAVRVLHVEGEIIFDAMGHPVLMFGTGQDITTRKELEADVQEVHRRLNEGREAERLHLARELHDMPMQEMHGAQMLLHELLAGIAQNHPTLDLTGFGAVQQRMKQANQMLRELCNELRPPVLAHFGVAAAVRQYVKRFQSEHPQIHIRVESRGDEVALPEWKGLALLRICQQALSNIAQHAGATEVTVRFLVQNQLIALEIQDNGKGFAVPARWIELARGRHFGILGSVERAESMGGHYRITSAEGKGTLVQVTVPQPEPEIDGAGSQ
jgi:PAS domain S-box-containing protein